MNQNMALLAPNKISSIVRESAQPLTGSPSDYDSLLEMIGGARFVLLGEATHGTHEFYHARVEISKRLVAEKGFSLIAWEADWPDALRVNRYVRGESSDAKTTEALTGFQRFPSWMWRNMDILNLVNWLCDHNSKTAWNPNSRNIWFGFI